MTRKVTGQMMNLTLMLDYVRESCKSVVLHNIPCQVKGNDFILDTLNQAQPLISQLAQIYPEIKSSHSSMDYWMNYLDTNYSTKRKKSSLNIKPNDARSLFKDADTWLGSILKLFSTNGTAFLNDELINNLITSASMKKLDKFAKEDLSDGVSSLLHLLPTPGATILLRFAERIIQKYYKKVIRKNPTKMTLGAIIFELEKSGKVKKSLLGYFHFINEKRIHVSHPYRRYNQEEGERILLNIMDLLEEIYHKR